MISDNNRLNRFNQCLVSSCLLLSFFSLFSLVVLDRSIIHSRVLTDIASCHAVLPVCCYILRV